MPCNRVLILSSIYLSGTLLFIRCLCVKMNWCKRYPQCYVLFRAQYDYKGSTGIIREQKFNEQSLYLSC